MGIGRNIQFPLEFDEQFGSVAVEVTVGMAKLEFEGRPDGVVVPTLPDGGAMTWKLGRWH